MEEEVDEEEEEDELKETVQIEAGHESRQKHYASCIQTNEKHSTTQQRNTKTPSKVLALRVRERART